MANFSDEHAVLLEKTLRSNRKVLEENKRLQEDIKVRDEAHKGLLNELMKEVKHLKEQQSTVRSTKTSNRRRGGSAKKTRVNVPPACRVSSISMLLCRS